METENSIALVLNAIKDLKDNFLEFVKVENERWEQNERCWEQNERRWEENEKRWEQNEKRWEENEKRWEQNDKRWEENDDKWERNHREFKIIYERLFDITELVGKRIDDHEIRINKLERNVLKLNA